MLEPSYHVVYETPVAWGEMDALGHVNNILYFRYFESARALYFQKIGVWDSAEKTGIGMILHSTSCRFRRPLKFPDTISIGTRTIEILNDRFNMKYEIWSDTQKAVVAEGEGLVVCYDYKKNAKCPIPETILEAIKKIEK